MKLQIKVYEKDGKTIKKVCEGETCEIMFGTVRKLMKCLDFENTKYNMQLLKNVYGVWEEIAGILEECFPTMELEDWNGVKVNELLPVLLKILIGAVNRLGEIPTESKNVAGV